MRKVKLDKELPGVQWSVKSVCERACVLFRLTKLAHFQDLTEHLGQFDAAAAKRTLVLVFSTAVLQDDLETRINVIK